MTKWDDIWDIFKARWATVCKGPICKEFEKMLSIVRYCQLSMSAIILIAVDTISNTTEYEKTNKLIDYSGSGCSFSALERLLGQLGIYATWLSSISYLQKQLRIFIFFYAAFFSVITRFLLFCVKPSGMCFIYSHRAFLKYQSSGFYCTWSKSHPLVDIRVCTLYKVSLSS